MIINMFKPDKYYKNIFEVNYETLKKQGIQIIACDLDNTLVPHFEKKPSPEVKQLFQQLKVMGFKVMVLSNNNFKRVSLFCEELEIDFYHSSRKPLLKNFKRILEDNNVMPNQVCLVGDQLLTDVFGARRIGMMCVFVDPLAEKDIFYTKINRFFEKKIIKRLERKKEFFIGEYYE